MDPRLASSFASGLPPGGGLPGDDGPPPDIRDLPSFLEHFLRNHRDDNFLSVKHGNYSVTSEEAPAEAVDWIMQYLHYM